MKKNGRVVHRIPGLEIGQECPCCHQQVRPNEEPLRTISLAEVLAMPPTDDAVDLLATCIRILCREGRDAQERACWRVADALWLLGQRFPHAAGIASRTGRGAKLSRPHPRKRP